MTDSIDEWIEAGQVIFDTVITIWQGTSGWPFACKFLPSFSNLQPIAAPLFYLHKHLVCRFGRFPRARGVTCRDMGLWSSTLSAGAANGGLLIAPSWFIVRSFAGLIPCMTYLIMKCASSSSVPLCSVRVIRCHFMGALTGNAAPVFCRLCRSRWPIPCHGDRQDYRTICLAL